MSTDQHIGDTSPDQEEHTKALVIGEESTALRVANEEQPRRRTPAKLPAHSQAAVAQRLNDVPEHPVPGVYYDGTHHPTHPQGWHIKRYIKRKNFRQTIQQIAVTDRKGTRVMIPLAASIFSVFLVAIILFVTLAGFLNATNQKYGSQIVTFQDILTKDSLKMYDAQNDLIFQDLSDGMQTSEPLSKISPNLAHAEVAIEDQSFYKNNGFDITGILRAAYLDLTHNGVVAGGSTITQQLVKNNLVGNKDTLIRKLQEIALAPQITHYYTKDQILEMYLNTTYYAHQAYGAEAAAMTYYGLKDTPKKTAAQQLDLAQAAMLAGIPSNPTARNPIDHPQAAFLRMQQVLQEMYLQGYITGPQKAAAIEEAQKPNFIKPSLMINNRLAANFASYALNEAANDLHIKVSDIARAGVVIHTSLNLSLQNKVLKVAQAQIASLAQAHHMSNASVVIVDQHTGAIDTLIGNIDPNNPVDGDFDVATQGYRQMGSSFKPYIYATAFGEGVSPGSSVLDGPLTIPMCCGLPSYTPMNYDLKFHGLMTYRYALQNSFNIPAVKLLMQVGVDNALNTAQSMGIASYTGTPNYTMVLGSLGVHLIDHVQGYATFANEGVKMPLHAIETITDQNGRVIIDSRQPKGIRVMSQAAAWMTTNVLTDNKARNYEFGPCSALVLYSNSLQQCYAGNPGATRPVAAKTGTTNNFDDNLTMGYTTDYTVGVWVGNNDNTPMINVDGVTGAGPIWNAAMKLAEQGKPIRQFPGPPSSVTQRPIPDLSGEATDWFLK